MAYERGKRRLKKKLRDKCRTLNERNVPIVNRKSLFIVVHGHIQKLKSDGRMVNVVVVVLVLIVFVFIFIIIIIIIIIIVIIIMIIIIIITIV